MLDIKNTALTRMEDVAYVCVCVCTMYMCDSVCVCASECVCLCVLCTYANDAINGWEAIGTIRRWLQRRKFEDERQTERSRQHDDRRTGTDCVELNSVLMSSSDSISSNRLVQNINVLQKYFDLIITSGLPKWASMLLPNDIFPTDSIIIILITI